MHNNISLIKKWEKEIIIVLQMEQYKDVENIDDELIAQIIGFLEDTEVKVNDYIRKLNTPPKNVNIGPYIV